MLASELISIIKSDLKLTDPFVVDDISLDACISEQDLIRFLNESIEEASFLIMHKYEDYFLASSTIALVAGQRRYSLPSDIMLEKIRRIYIHDASDFFTSQIHQKVTPIFKLDDCLNYKEPIEYPSRYMLIHNMGVGEIAQASYPLAINLFPIPSSSSRYLTINYIKKPTTITTLADKIDFEFTGFLKEDMKERIVRNKDIGNPMTSYIMQKRQEQKDLMLISMSNKIPDDSNEMNQLSEDEYFNLYGGII